MLELIVFLETGDTLCSILFTSDKSGIYYEQQTRLKRIEILLLVYLHFSSNIFSSIFKYITGGIMYFLFEKFKVHINSL